MIVVFNDFHHDSRVNGKAIFPAPIPTHQLPRYSYRVDKIATLNIKDLVLENYAIGAFYFIGNPGYCNRFVIFTNDRGIFVEMPSNNGGVDSNALGNFCKEYEASDSVLFKSTLGNRFMTIFASVREDVAVSELQKTSNRSWSHLPPYWRNLVEKIDTTPDLSRVVAKSNDEPMPLEVAEYLAHSPDPFTWANLAQNDAIPMEMVSWATHVAPFEFLKNPICHLLIGETERGRISPLFFSEYQAMVTSELGMKTGALPRI